TQARGAVVELGTKLSKAAGKAGDAPFVGEAEAEMPSAKAIARARRRIRGGIETLEKPASALMPTHRPRQWLRAIDDIESAMRKAQGAIPDEVGAPAHTQLQGARAHLNWSRHHIKVPLAVEATYPKQAQAGQARAAARLVDQYLAM